MYSENPYDDGHLNPAFDSDFAPGNALQIHGERPSVHRGLNDGWASSSNAASSSSRHHPLDIPSKPHSGPSESTYPHHATRSFSASYTQDSSVVSSPAAMFLSAFSSPVAPVASTDAEGQVVSGYTLGPIIGYGGFSIIRRASSSSGTVAAVKIVRRADLSKQANPALARRRLQHEATVWATLSHEHILPLFSTSQTAQADFFFTLYCPAGSLYDILKRDGRPALPQDDAGMMFRQIVRGLRYMHQDAMYVHRDIKLENVLVDEQGVCRITDFGMTRKIGEIDEDDFVLDLEDPGCDALDPDQAVIPSNSVMQRAVSLTMPRKHAKTGLHHHLSMMRHTSSRHRRSTTARGSSPGPPLHFFQPGSLPYASPELLLPPSSAPLPPHPAQDIWALGVLLYVLLSGRFPFSDSFEPRLQMKILHGSYESLPDIGRGAERVLQGCLERSVQDRWSIDRIDEVGWGIGWGTEGDDVSPEDSDSEHLARRASKNASKVRSRSRSRHRPADIIIPSPTPDWQQDEPRSRPSLEAARRRSTSRVERSLSRAPVLTDRSSSDRRRSDRSVSRPPQPTPACLSALSNSILRSASCMSSAVSSGSSSSDLASPLDESALLMSPSPARGRGRRPRNEGRSSSRSPSPSIVPRTPTDSIGPFASSVPLQLSDRSPSRGRTKYAARARSPLYAAEPHAELGVLHEHEHDEEHSATAARLTVSPGGVVLTRHQGRADSPSPPSAVALTALGSSVRHPEQRGMAASALRHLGGGSSGKLYGSSGADDASKSARRAGSTPPAPMTSWLKGDIEGGAAALRFVDTPTYRGHRHNRSHGHGDRVAGSPLVGARGFAGAKVGAGGISGGALGDRGSVGVRSRSVEVQQRDAPALRTG